MLYGWSETGSNARGIGFNHYAKDSLNRYRVIDPEMWSKLVGRIKGVNFGSI